MTAWKDGGPYGRYCRGVHDETGDNAICYVWVKENGPNSSVIDSPQGEANFALVLAAPKMLEALRAIAKGAIVSPDQSPEQVAKQALHVLQIAREAAAEYMIYAGKQQQRAEQAEAALCAIRNKVECYAQPLPPGSVASARWEAVRKLAVDAIAAGEEE